MNLRKHHEMDSLEMFADGYRRYTMCGTPRTRRLRAVATLGAVP